MAANPPGYGSNGRFGIITLAIALNVTQLRGVKPKRRQGNHDSIAASVDGSSRGTPDFEQARRPHSAVPAARRIVRPQCPAVGAGLAEV
jgi:hypothetical protein